MSRGTRAYACRWGSVVGLPSPESPILLACDFVTTLHPSLPSPVHADTSFARKISDRWLEPGLQPLSGPSRRGSFVSNLGDVVWAVDHRVIAPQKRRYGSGWT